MSYKSYKSYKSYILNVNPVTAFGVPAYFPRSL